MTARAALLPAAVLLALTGCSNPLGQAQEPAADTGTTTVQPTTQPTTQATAQAGVNFDMRSVNPYGPACGSTWVPGNLLPANYEWCSGEDGAPVAGVRIGSCEVVVYQGTLYAVPGRRVQQANGPLSQDPGFRAALTGCGRRPFVPAR